jgi:hypothetical protein
MNKMNFALSLLSFLLTFIADLGAGTLIFSLIVTFLSSFVLLNFLQHVIWTLQFKAYATGLATALLCFLSVIFVNLELIQNGLIHLPFYLITLLTAPPLIGTMKVKGVMTREVQNVHHFFIRAEKTLAGLLRKCR